jgi:hypothetical protein
MNYFLNLSIKLLNNNALKSSVESRKVYYLTIDDICKYDVDTYKDIVTSFFVIMWTQVLKNQTHLTVVLYIIVFAL